jgi:predicted peptidase
MGDTDVLRCLAEAKRLLSVDENRVYLTGDSMGGWGTWNVASRHPDLFAAIAPVFGGVDYHSELTEEQLAALDPVERFWEDKRSSWSMADSLINMPIYVHHGDQDHSVNVEYSRYEFACCSAGADVRYQYPGSATKPKDKVSKDLSSRGREHRRNLIRSGAHSFGRAARNARRSWASVRQAASPLEFMVVDARSWIAT